MNATSTAGARISQCPGSPRRPACREPTGAARVPLFSPVPRCPSRGG